MRTLRRVCVYCGSSNGVSDVYQQAAAQLGVALAQQGIGLVYGGGRVGLMGVVADAALDAGGEVYGVIPEALQALELGHEGCTELFVVPSMHPRKMLMASLSDAFIALPGGWGTLEEMSEVVTWTQLRMHHKPVGMLNVAGYYDPLIQWIGAAQREGFVRPQHRSLLTVREDPVALLDALRTAPLPPHPSEWARP